MKKIIFIAIAFFTLSITAQNNSNTAERLIGTWVLDYNKSLNQVQSKSREYYNNLEQEKKNRIQSSFSQRRVIFLPDGSYTLAVNANQQFNGTWELLGDQETIVLRMNDGKEYRQFIENISTSSMLLNLGGDQSKSRLFRKWHLIKQTN